ncbi:MAG: translation factor SUA5 [uncultured archaeon A07HN63]|nr:MAG: translation factor SUA5 [uncultured archaeon A07HN63]
MSPDDDSGPAEASETSGERASTDIAPVVDDAIAAAADAIQQGAAVVYPTKTVYGLGADATDADAINRVYEIKGRPRSNPLSVAFTDRGMAEQYVTPTDRERAFMKRFLPGPVTVLVDREEAFPDVLTADRDTVGVRVPDSAVARELVRRAGPITATSANESGSPSVRRVESLAAGVREAVGSVIDTGETPGTESTVVDIESGDIHRRGALADEIETWLAEH